MRECEARSNPVSVCQISVPVSLTHIHHHLKTEDLHHIRPVFPGKVLSLSCCQKCTKLLPVRPLPISCSLLYCRMFSHMSRYSPYVLPGSYCFPTVRKTGYFQSAPAYSGYFLTRLLLLCADQTPGPPQAAEQLRRSLPIIAFLSALLIIPYHSPSSLSFLPGIYYPGQMSSYPLTIWLQSSITVFPSAPGSHC